ncbi:MAG: glycosyltransferase, partial [Paracoccaceae bacterium]
MSRIGRRRGALVQRAESDARALAIARARRGNLPQILARHLPNGFDYFNVGHSNLTARVFDALRACAGQTHVLIHDVIPLTHPEFQRAGTVRAFRNKLEQVSAQADRVIFNSEDTRRTATGFMRDMGRVPPAIVAHLGLTPAKPDPGELPQGLPPARPYFITVGTIEPRKNHGFLLDLWAEMGADAPPLLICGARGWNNTEVFARLDALPAGSPIRELPNLDDPALAALIQGSAGMLFPSQVEGFGLPPLEALSLGTRVL